MHDGSPGARAPPAGADDGRDAERAGDDGGVRRRPAAAVQMPRMRWDRAARCRMGARSSATRMTGAPVTRLAVLGAGEDAEHALPDVVQVGSAAAMRSSCTGAARPRARRDDMLPGPRRAVPGLDQRRDFGHQVLVAEQRLVRAEDGRLALAGPRRDRVVDVVELLARALDGLGQRQALGGGVALARGPRRPRGPRGTGPSGRRRRRETQGSPATAWMARSSPPCARPAPRARPPRPARSPPPRAARRAPPRRPARWRPGGSSRRCPRRARAASPLPARSPSVRRPPPASPRRSAPRPRRRRWRAASAAATAPTIRTSTCSPRPRPAAGVGRARVRAATISAGRVVRASRVARARSSSASLSAARTRGAPPPARRCPRPAAPSARVPTRRPRRAARP